MHDFVILGILSIFISVIIVGGMYLEYKYEEWKEERRYRKYLKKKEKQ